MLLKRLFTTALVSLAAFTGGCNGEKKIDGLDKVQIAVVQRHLYFGFVAKDLQWDAGISMPIPGLKDSTLSIMPDFQSRGTVFQIMIPLKSMNGSGDLQPVLGGLPDGRPLPDVRGGELPRWDIEAGKIDFSFYLSEDAFGFFIPLKLRLMTDLPVSSVASFDIEDERGNRLGKLYLVPSMKLNGNGSGLFVLLPFIGGASSASGLMAH